MKIGVYKHYKGKLYEVIGEGKNSETLEDFVIYCPLYIIEEFSDVKYWIRPKDMFFDKVNIDGEKVNRFEYIGDLKYENI